jgi:hypothetical protein
MILPHSHIGWKKKCFGLPGNPPVLYGINQNGHFIGVHGRKEEGILQNTRQPLLLLLENSSSMRELKRALSWWFGCLENRELSNTYIFSGYNPNHGSLLILLDSYP